MDYRSHEPAALEPSQRASSAFGLGVAATVMTGFGFTWLGWGFASVGFFTPALWMIFYVATLALLIPAIRAWRSAKVLTQANPAGDSVWARSGKQFKIITAGEGLGCGLVVLLTLVFHHLDLLAAGISLVVGLHFLPLARLFRFPIYYWSGAAVILCDGVSIVWFKSSAITASVGIATGTILWATALYALLRCNRFLQEGRT